MSFIASEFETIFIWAIAAYANPEIKKKLVEFINTSWMIFRFELW